MGMELIKNVIFNPASCSNKKGKKAFYQATTGKKQIFCKEKKQTIAQQTCMWRNWWCGTNNTLPNLRRL